ncbi:MAG: LAGLIDADG family homing endonuclease [Candidatus Aenigmatarchaeota archaeon]
MKYERGVKMNVRKELNLWDLTNERIYVKIDPAVIRSFFDYSVKFVGTQNRLSIMLKRKRLTHIKEYKTGKSFVQLKLIKDILNLLPHDMSIKFKKLLNDNLKEIKCSGSLSKPINNPKFPITLNSSLVELLGHLLGDGCIEFRSNCPIIWYTNKSEELLNRFSELIQNVFGNVNLYKRTQRNGVKDIRCPTIIGMLLNEFLSFKSIKSLDFLANLVDGQKEIFLQALFDDEGCVTIPKYQIIIEMTNKKLIQIIKTMLLELGINSGKIREVNSYYKRRYRLCISGKKNLELFRNKINFVNSDKKYKLNTLLSSYKLK